MKTYTQFHGGIPIDQIGKELRNIVKYEHKPFKVVTGYGSMSGHCKSKQAVLRSLGKMLREGSISGYIPADCIGEHTKEPDHLYCRMVESYGDYLYKDGDYMNAGVIFVVPR